MLQRILVVGAPEFSVEFSKSLGAVDIKASNSASGLLQSFSQNSLARPRAAAARDTAAEPQNGSTSRVRLAGRYCRINAASARLLP